MLNSSLVTDIYQAILYLVPSWSTSHRSPESVVWLFSLLILDWERERLESSVFHVMRMGTIPRTVLRKRLAVPHPRVCSRLMVCQLSLCHVGCVATPTRWRKARIKESLRPAWLHVRNLGRCQSMKGHRPWQMSVDV